MKFEKGKYIVAVLMLMSIVPVYSQVTINVNEYPAIGTESVYLADTTGSIVVNVGNSGTGQTWDFTQALQGAKFEQLYQVPSQDTLYYIDDFSRAQWVVKSKQYLSIAQIDYLLPDGAKDLFALNTFEYANNNNIYAIGMGTANPIYAGSIVYDSDQIRYSFPLSVGKTWYRKAVYMKQITITIGVPVKVNLFVTDSSYVEVDGSGTLTIPAGSFQCVRLKIHRTFILTAKLAATGTELTEVSENFISYEWFTANIGPVLEIVSHSGETNENFTDASLVVRLDSSNKMTGICDPECEDNTSVPNDFRLEQNFPNPFNPETTIRYSLSTLAKVDIFIYSSRGEEIARIERGLEGEGFHQIIWNAEDRNGEKLSAGVYFYKFKVVPLNGNAPFTITKKMVLLK